LVAAVALAAGGLVAAPPAHSEELSAMEITQGADARIREYRTADLTVEVVDQQGKPVDGAEVEVRQTRHAFLFGCNIFAWQQPTPEDCAQYRDQYEALLNYATLPFYWRGYEPQPGKPQHARCEAIARWCKEHNITTKGHPLVWNHIAGTPAWLPEDPAEVVRLSDARVADVVGRFKGLIDIWDVVNEAADPFRTGPEFDGRMTETWKHFGKMPLTIEPFKIAREANPDATLLINDYRVDPEYEKVIEQLVGDDGKSLYNVIGIQSHMHGGAWSTEKIWHVCETFARFGVPLHFTETTIVSGPRTQAGWETTPEGEQLQADEVERFYTVLFSHPAVQAITWWDFADRNAWQGAPAGFLRKDLSPKPAYDRLLGLIKGKWWTQAAGKAEGGRFTTRAFYGDYEITVRRGGATKTVGFELAKDGAHDVKVTM
jgi:GH35 family endo-1,4-beta-xylanase